MNREQLNQILNEIGMSINDDIEAVEQRLQALYSDKLDDLTLNTIVKKVSDKMREDKEQSAIDRLFKLMGTSEQSDKVTHSSKEETNTNQSQPESFDKEATSDDNLLNLLDVLGLQDLTTDSEVIDVDGSSQEDLVDIFDVLNNFEVDEPVSEPIQEPENQIDELLSILDDIEVDETIFASDKLEIQQQELEELDEIETNSPPQMSDEDDLLAALNMIVPEDTQLQKENESELESITQTPDKDDLLAALDSIELETPNQPQIGKDLESSLDKLISRQAKTKRRGFGWIVPVLLLLSLLVSGFVFREPIFAMLNINQNQPDDSNLVLEDDEINQNDDNSDSVVDQVDEEDAPDMPEVVEVDSYFENETLNDAVYSFLRKERHETLSSSDFSQIFSIRYSGDKIYINELLQDVSVPSGIFAFTDLDLFENLDKIEITDNVNAISFQLDVDNYSVNQLVVDNSYLQHELDSIDRLTALNVIKVTNTNLSNIETLRNYSHLDTVYLYNNEIKNIDPLEDVSIQFINLASNHVADFQSLVDIEEVNIWDEKEYGLDFKQITHSRLRDSSKREVEILINNLRVRESHSLDGEIIEYAKIGYYTILGEYWDSKENLLWVRLASDAWMATNEGNWTKIHE